MPYKVDTVAFSGLLKWEEVENLVGHVRNSDSLWNYAYTQLGDERGELDSDKAAEFIKKRMEEIRKLDEICGWFYVHMKENPSIIKVYHPSLSCGFCSMANPLPWIIISTEKLEDIADLESYKPIEKTKKNKGIFKIFG
ncbi:hypothetical protein ACMCNP_04220 [Candidatus Acidulodesulfobacterium sp. H_13]|uniref:hypothetical protein n=1 Tax=Candidatus Acidulodesulfobacterium sp. H_13 TaxID=3395470 RepID=UPI003AF6171F